MKRGQKGFTLVEVLVVVAILGVIAVPLAYTTITLLTNPARSNDENVVLQQVRNVGDWISRDVQMAKNVVFDDPSGFPLTMVIPVDTDENNDYSVDYLFDGNKLKRQVYDSSQTLVSENLIAEYVNTEDTTFDIRDSNVYELTIKASKDEAVAEGSYQVTPMPSSS